MLRRKITRIISFLLSIMLVFSTNVFADSKDDKQLTEKEIWERFEEIRSEYEIGEPLSLEDSNFVKKYATKVIADINKETDIVDAIESPITTMSYKEDDFVKWGYGDGNTIIAKMYGIVWGEINIINHSYGANFTTEIRAGLDKVDLIEAEVKHEAFGVVGSDGLIGLVYTGTIDGSTTNTTYVFNRSENYTAVTLYAVTRAKSTIHYTNSSGVSGSFDIHSH